MPITALPTLSPTSLTFKADVDSFFGNKIPAFSVEAEAARVEINAANITAVAAAANAAASAALASAAANYKGPWSALSGALNMPASVQHNGNFWALNVNLANVATATPGISSSWSSLAVGAGGALELTSAVSVALTSASFKVQSVGMTAAGQSVTLPNATTLATGGELFVIKNSGLIEYAVRDFGGKMIMLLAAGEACLLHLANASTTAGTWSVGHLPDVALSQSMLQATATTVNAVATSQLSVTRLSATQAIAVWGTGAGTLACTLNLSGNAVSAGAAISVTGGGGPDAMCVTALSATQAIVGTKGPPGFLNVCTLNVSGTVLSAGAMLVVNGAITAFISIAVVSATQAVVAYQGVSGLAQACTLNVSGTTVTNGAIVNLSAAAATQVSVTVLSAAQAVAVFLSSGSTLGVSVQISGTTLTPGAECFVQLGMSPGKTALAFLSATQALCAVAAGTGTLVRPINVIAGNLLAADAAATLVRSTTTGASMLALRQVNAKNYVLVDALDAFSGTVTRNQPRAQMLALRNSAIVFGQPCMIKNSSLQTNFCDVAAMSDNLMLTVYLEPSGFVQARILEIGA